MIVSKEVKIGAVFFIAIAVLVIFAIAVGVLPLGGGHAMTVYFDEVLGLEAGNDVWLSGKKIGSVQRLSHAPVTGPDGRQALMVKVVFNLDHEVALCNDYTITVVDKSVIGGRAVEIKAGTPGNPLHAGPIYGSSRGNPLATIGGEFTKSLRVIDSFVDVLKDIQEGKGTLGMLIADDKLYVNLVAAAENTGKVMKIFASEESNFRLLMEDKELLANIKGVVEEIKKAAEGAAALLERINDPESFFSRLTADRALFARMESIVVGLEEFSEKLAAGKGLGRLLTDEGFYRDIAEITAEMRHTVRVAHELIAEVQRDPQVLIAGRPSGRESWLVKQLRGDGKAPIVSVTQDTRKLVPED